VWFVCLAYRQFNAGKFLIKFHILFIIHCFMIGTYFSENALLPGLVHSNFKEDFLARQYVAAIKVRLGYFKIYYILHFMDFNNEIFFVSCRQKLKDTQMECPMHSLLLSSNN
jgi:predicted secreted protein